MNNAELTKSQIIKSASSSLGSSLQQTRRKLGFDLNTVMQNTNIPIPLIDRLELGISNKLNLAVKLALFYNKEIRIELVEPQQTTLK